MNRDFKQMRKFLDGDDPFMVGGHQMSGFRKRQRQVPEWTRNDAKIRNILLKAFPKLMTDAKQRKSAARWAMVIHLYFRLQYTNTQTGAELGISPVSVSFIARAVKRVAAGKPANGSQPVRSRRGRPKKIRAILPSTMGETK